MKNDDLLYQVALTRVPQIGDVHAKTLIGIYGTAEKIFRASKRELEKIEGIGTVRAGSIRQFTDFGACEKEISFIDKFHIQPIFYTSESYPKRLVNCYDSPVLLYYKGNADLNTDKVLSVVGTRKNTAYGKQCCEDILEGLRGTGILIVSGLAFGIDSIAHKSALLHGLPTVAALAHGLDRIYPGQNRPLAKQMIDQGGLITDFGMGTSPDKQHFPKRNRITAGICDALLVIESGNKGGSLITADIANSYHKDVFAVPGRVTDPGSKGCHELIRRNKAQLISSAADLMEAMNWDTKPPKVKTIQRSLFADLPEPEKKIVAYLQQQPSGQIDDMQSALQISSSSMSGALLNLELMGMIVSMPGKMYKLL